jgi:hypothetical protein
MTVGWVGENIKKLFSRKGGRFARTRNQLKDILFNS